MMSFEKLNIQQQTKEIFGKLKNLWNLEKNRSNSMRQLT